MKILLLLFLVCLVVVAWRWHNKLASRRTEIEPSPATPDPAEGKTGFASPRDRSPERGFLELLVAHGASEDGRQLQDRLAQAERD